MTFVNVTIDQWRDCPYATQIGAGSVAPYLGNEQERRSDEHDGGGEAMDSPGD
jgi:hypothetical protein